MHTKAYWSLISTFITFLHFFSQIEVSPVVDKIEITNKVNNKIVANHMRNQGWPEKDQSGFNRLVLTGLNHLKKPNFDHRKWSKLKKTGIFSS